MISPIGSRLRERRKAKGMTQQQLAKAVGVAQSTIAQIERGDSKSATATNLMRIAAVLETNPQWLLSGKGDPNLASYAPDDADVMSIASSLTDEARRAWIAAGLAMIQASNTQ